MNYITVAFSHDPRSLFSRVISYLTFGRMSHVALVNGDEVIEAMADSAIYTGVRRIKLLEWIDQNPGGEIRRIRHPWPVAVWVHARTQIGKPYDWGWVLGFFFRQRNWHDEQKWTCAELIAWACEKAGKPILAGDAQWCVTPNILYMISEPNDEHLY